MAVLALQPSTALPLVVPVHLTLPHVVSSPGADSSLLVYDVFHGARSVQVPGVPAVYASPPVEKRKKRSPQVEVVGDHLKENNIEEDS